MTQPSSSESEHKPTACACQLRRWLARAYSGGTLEQLIEKANETDDDLIAHMRFEETYLMPRLTDRAVADRLHLEHMIITAAIRQHLTDSPRFKELLEKHTRLENYIMDHDPMMTIFRD